MADETQTQTAEQPDKRTPEEIKATIAKLEAEAQKTLAEARKAAAEAEQAECEAYGSQVAKRMLVEKNAEELASDRYRHIYRFTGKVDETSTKNCAQQLIKWSRVDPGCDMEVVFFSPGGSVIDGMMLFDTIIGLRAQGHNITTTAMGYAASMGGILLQAGTKRCMGKEAYILIHEVASGAFGKTSELEDEVAFMKKIQKRVIQIFVERSHGKLKATTIQRKWKKTDWWLDSDEALERGVVDEVV